MRAFLEREPRSANVIGPNHATPLCYVHGVDMAHLLLEHGADMFRKLDDPWCREQGTDTPLRWAASRPETGMLRYFLTWAGIAWDIFLACAVGDAEQVAAMLAHDADLVAARTGDDHPLPKGHTPLHVAARYGHATVAALLLRHGADVNATIHAGQMTPLHLAVWLSAGDAPYVAVEVPRLLLEHGADLTARDTERLLTPLGWAEAQWEGDEKDRSAVAALLRTYGARS